MTAPEAPSAVVSLRGRRSGNEDAVLSVRLSDGRHLCAVADGMGGHRCGEVASSLALEALHRALEDGASLREAMEAANARVHGESVSNPERAGMGTTLVVLLRAGGSYEIGNVGDSRAYRVDREGIFQITSDHSFAAEAARSGMMSPEEVERSPWRNALTRSLGTQARVEVDVFGPYPASAPPHLVLLCSDGLYRPLGDEGMREHLLGSPGLEPAVASLAELAIRRGSDDNVSAAVMVFGPMAVQPTVPRVAPRTFSPARPQPVAVPLAGPALAVRASAEGRWVVAGERSGRAVPAWLRAVLREQNLFLLCIAVLLVWFVSLLSHL
jgi:protein phosphatase